MIFQSSIKTRILVSVFVLILVVVRVGELIRFCDFDFCFCVFFVVVCIWCGPSIWVRFRVWAWIWIILQFLFSVEAFRIRVWSSGFRFRVSGFSVNDSSYFLDIRMWDLFELWVWFLVSIMISFGFYQRFIIEGVSHNLWNRAFDHVVHGLGSRVSVQAIPVGKAHWITWSRVWGLRFRQYPLESHIRSWGQGVGHRVKSVGLRAQAIFFGIAHSISGSGGSWTWLQGEHTSSWEERLEAKQSYEVHCLLIMIWSLELCLLTDTFAKKERFEARNTNCEMDFLWLMDLAISRSKLLRERIPGPWEEIKVQRMQTSMNSSSWLWNALIWSRQGRKCPTERKQYSPK